MPKAPRISSLSRQEIDDILARNYVGRLAYSFEDRVDIEPIHYVYGEGALYARTSPGSKLTTLMHNRWVAFEVDEVEDLFDWRSVVVRGVVYPVESGDGAYARTLERLRSLIPETLAEDDPTPFRSFLFRIHLESVTGRKAEQLGPLLRPRRS